MSDFGPWKPRLDRTWTATSEVRAHYFELSVEPTEIVVLMASPCCKAPLTPRRRCTACSTVVHWRNSRSWKVPACFRFSFPNLETLPTEEEIELQAEAFNYELTELAFSDHDPLLTVIEAQEFTAHTTALINSLVPWRKQLDQAYNQSLLAGKSVYSSQRKRARQQHTLTVLNRQLWNRWKKANSS